MVAVDWGVALAGLKQNPAPRAAADPLIDLCNIAHRATGCDYPSGAVHFFLARWYQKRAVKASPARKAAWAAKAAQPQVNRDVWPPTTESLSDKAAAVATHLHEDAACTLALRACDNDAWMILIAQLTRTASRFHGIAVANAEDLVQATCARIFDILTRGTPVDQAATSIHIGGDRNEFVFDVVFLAWARQIVIRRGLDLVDGNPAPLPIEDGYDIADDSAGWWEDRIIIGITKDMEDLVRRAIAMIDELVRAIDRLPPRQGDVIRWTLRLESLEPVVREVIAWRATLLGVAWPTATVNNDEEIAAILGTNVGNVRANRSVARQTLRNIHLDDPFWVAMIDRLMPRPRPNRGPTEGGQ